MCKYLIYERYILIIIVINYISVLFKIQEASEVSLRHSHVHCIFAIVISIGMYMCTSD